MKEVLKAEEAKPVQETKSSDTIFVMNPITEVSAKPKSKFEGMLYEDASGFVRKTDSDVVKIVDILNYSETSFDVKATAEDFVNNFVMGVIDQGRRLYIMCMVDEITFDPKMGRFSRMDATAYGKKWRTYFDSKEEGITHFELIDEPTPEDNVKYCGFQWLTEGESFRLSGVTIEDMEKYHVVGTYSASKGIETYFNVKFISAIYYDGQFSQGICELDSKRYVMNYHVGADSITCIRQTDKEFVELKKVEVLESAENSITIDCTVEDFEKYIVCAYALSESGNMAFYARTELSNIIYNIDDTVSHIEIDFMGKHYLCHQPARGVSPMRFVVGTPSESEVN